MKTPFSERNSVQYQYQYCIQRLPLYHDRQIQPEVNCVLTDLYCDVQILFFSLFLHLAEIYVMKTIPYV